MQKRAFRRMAVLSNLEKEGVRSDKKLTEIFAQKKFLILKKNEL